MISIMNCKVRIYDGVKFSRCKKVKDILYINIRGFEVVTGERADKISNETDASSIDPYNEYLVIYLEDGSTATYGYSKADLFIDHRKDDTMKQVKTNHEAMHMLSDRAREYLAYMNATIKGNSNDLEIYYPNGKRDWLGDINVADKYLKVLNPYVVYETSNENDEPLEEFDDLDRLKEWCYLQKASDIATGHEPRQFYYKYCYCVEEGGDFV